MTKTMILKTMFIAYVALVFFLSICECDPLTEASITGFTTDLIHRDSPQSPSYDPSLSPYQRLINALKRSFDRAQHFKAKQSKDTPESDMIPTGGDYLMKYSVGTPPVPSLGIADTGSDIIWTQCQPCFKCFNQSLPIFEPNNSSTYRKIPCSAPKCSYFPQTSCSRARKNCLYSETYGDKSFTHGELATDTFALASTGGKRVSIPNIIFGCGVKNGGLFSGSESGIVGLGGGKVSLVRQLGPLAQGKFSYCLQIPLSHHSKSSKLHFGSNAEVSGSGVVSTPFVEKTSDTFYYLTLEGISVGNQRLELLSDLGHYEEGNIVIDSGTTLTLLPPDIYAKLENAIKSSIKMKQIEDPQGELNLCFFSQKDMQIPIPEITVHFKGADLKLKQDNIFVRTSDVSLCLAAQPTDDLPIYGNLAQTNFLVGYDLEKRTVSFKPTDCAK